MVFIWKLVYKPPKTAETRGRLLQKFILSRDGPVKNTETRQRWKHAGRLYPTKGMMVEKKDQKSTLHLHSFLLEMNFCRNFFPLVLLTVIEKNCLDKSWLWQVTFWFVLSFWMYKWKSYHEPWLYGIDTPQSWSKFLEGLAPHLRGFSYNGKGGNLVVEVLPSVSFW